MNRVRNSVMLLIVGVVVVGFSVNEGFFSYTDNTPQRQQMPKESGAKNNAQQTKAYVLSPSSSPSTISSAPPQPLRADVMDESALPIESTIPSELLYLDDQPIEFDSETNDDSHQDDEVELQPADEIDPALPDENTIPPELLQLDQEPAEPK